MSRRDRDAARETETPAVDPASPALSLDAGPTAADEDAPAAPPTDPEQPAVEAPAAAEAGGEPKTTWLTTRADETFGAAGRFVDLTAEEKAGAPEDLFVEPTPEQLALRVRN